MEIISFILAGIFMGLPFGPVGILCVGKTLEQGKFMGFSASLGVILVDLIYAVLAFIFLQFFSDKIAQYDTILKVLIGLFLIFIGTKKFIKKTDIKRESDLREDKNSYLKNFCELFLISIPNIFNIASLITVFTALDIYRYSGSVILTKLIFTMLITEVTLWYITTSVFHKLREKITDRTVQILVKSCASLVILLGAILEIKVLLNILILY
ncbi:MAG: LysE family translocator [Fusobacteriaceae bacterium]